MPINHHALQTEDNGGVVRYIFVATFEAKSMKEAHDKMRAFWAGDDIIGMWQDMTMFHDTTLETIETWGAGITNRILRRLFRSPDFLSRGGAKTRRVA